MKYEIDTIPVWDAVRAASPCPLCLLEKRSRLGALRYYLGPSVMVPEVRVTVNDRGFAPDTWRLLSKDPNKLGLALLTHTRLKTLRGKLAKRTGALRAAAEKASGKAIKDQLAQTAALLAEARSRCLVEEKVEADLARYAYTLVYLWGKDPEFRPVWKAGQAACLKHLPGLFDLAQEQLGTVPLAAFVTETLDALDAGLNAAEADLLAFTQTFDSTHSHAPAGNPQGALDRGLQKMNGVFAEYEEEPKARRGPLMGGVSGG